ncbi:MAG: hypothetical protein A3H94_07665 [Acidobacteria bacterium RIFCSPLOWO2_02_FULL_60_20]|nr:MAG: hypothetical protein A3H94_07665 [Acidobacteria bacterium RIFCSPLOWO2_02_FULL_60_20]
MTGSNRRPVRSPGNGSRCEKCPLDRLDAAQHSEAGQLLRRALDLRAALRIGISLSLCDIAADEFFTMLIIEEEQDRLEREQSQPHGR